MTSQQAGKIASRSIGILLLIIGLVILIEYYQVLQLAKSIPGESGWSSYSPADSIEATSEESLISHDSYYVSSSPSPHIVCGLGILFIAAANPIGKLIAGKDSLG